MNIIENIKSIFIPKKMWNGLYVRKRLFHSGYEILRKQEDKYIHVSYVRSI